MWSALKKSTLGLTLGTVLIVVGIVLSVGANYGLIKDTSTFATKSSFSGQGWTQAVLLADTQLSLGDIVAFSTSYTMAVTAKSFSISVKDSFGRTIVTQSFVYSGDAWGQWNPDLSKPFTLFTVQNSGGYRVSASPLHGDFSFDEFTFNIVVTHPPPYTLVLMLGFVLLALGVLSVIYGVVSHTKVPSASLPPSNARLTRVLRMEKIPIKRTIPSGRHMFPTTTPE